MSNKIKTIDIKTHTRCFFDDIINVKFLIQIILKYMKSHNVMIKDLKYVKINSVILLYLIFSKVNGYFEEINKNKYLTLVPTN